MKDVCRRLLSLLTCALLASAAVAFADAPLPVEQLSLHEAAGAGGAPHAPDAAPEARGEMEAEIEASMLELSAAANSKSAAEAAPEASAAAEAATGAAETAAPEASATAEAGASQATPEADATEAPSPEASAAPEAPSPEASETPAPEASEAPTPEASETPAPSAMAVHASRSSAAAQSDFHCGYARINGNVPAYAGAYPGAELDCYLTSSGVVYALSRRSASGCDRLECALDDGEGERRVWIDARWLYPLDSEAAQAFVQERLAEADVRCLSGEGLPIDRLSCAPAVRYQLGDDGIDAEPTEAPAMLLERAELTLRVGESARLEVGFSDGGDYDLSFMSRNNRIARTSEDGEVLARREGSTVILVRSELGAEASVRVTVVE